MDVDSGKFREIDRIQKRSKANRVIDKKEVMCPKIPEFINAMRSWGKKKRQRYAHLVKVIGYHEEEAYGIVENHKGEIQPCT